MYSNHWRWYLDEMFGWLPDDAGETEILIGQAQTVGMVCKSLGISEQSYYRWRREYGVLKLDQASPLKVRYHRVSDLRGLKARKPPPGQAGWRCLLSDKAPGRFAL